MNGLEVLESFTPETSQTITLCTNDVVDAANFQIIFGICHFIQIGLGNITRISQIISYIDQYLCWNKVKGKYQHEELFNKLLQ